MLFAIKYDTNRRGLNLINQSLNKYGSAILFRGDNTGIFFSNPFVALQISHNLNSKKNGLSYQVYKLTKEQENEIDESLIVSTYEEYQTLAKKQIDDALKKLEELNDTDISSLESEQ